MTVENCGKYGHKASDCWCKQANKSQGKGKGKGKGKVEILGDRNQ